MPVVINERTLWETIWGKDSFGLLFLMLLCDYVVLTLVDSPQWGGLARGVPLALTVLFAVHTSAASPRLVRVAQVAVVLALVGGILEAATGGRGGRGRLPAPDPAAHGHPGGDPAAGPAQARG